MKKNLLLVVLFLAIWTLKGQTSWYNENVRRIHMDFHTPEIEPDVVIKSFNVKDYVATLKGAQVNSLVTFAKDHHGNSYYNSRLGHKHSGLPANTDMMGEIIDECHKNDIKVLSYFSVGWLTTVEKNHSEWMERDINGNKMGTSGKPETRTWNCICLNSPYVEQIVIPELKEIATNYNPDGIWIDIIENNPCYCDWCKAKYKQQYNQEYPNENAKVKAFAVRTRVDFIKKCRTAIKSIKPGIMMSYNTAGRTKELIPYVDFLILETHPGAPWHKGAWTQALLTYKFLQQYNMPWETCTSRFIHGWGGWDDQTTENMMTNAARIISHGGVVNLGDQTYPDGTLDKELYKKIGIAFSFTKEMEKWCIGAKQFPNIALFTSDFDIYSNTNSNYFGAVKILNEKHWHFDIINESAIDRLKDYKCIVLSNIGEISDKLGDAFKKYVSEGGTLLATGNTSLSKTSNSFKLSEIFGAQYKSPGQFSIGYLQLNDLVAQNTRRSALLVPGRFNEIIPSEKAIVLSKLVNPIFEPKPEELLMFRNPDLSPPGKEAKTPAIICNSFGKGKTVYVAAPIFDVFWDQSQWYLKDVANNLLNYLMPVKNIQLDASATVELNVTQKDNKLIVHLINYNTQRETYQVEELLPAYNVELKVAKSLVNFANIKVLPTTTEFETSLDDVNITIKLPKVGLYTQIIFDKK